jgi:AraC-like DNA-binding protein
MKVHIPDLLIQNNLLKTVDELSFAKYITHTPMSKSKVKMNSNALIYVTKGTKILHFSDKDRSIEAGDILFIKSGSYVMTEVLDEVYEGLLFFYSDELLNNFITKYNVEFSSSDTQEDIFIINGDKFLQNGLLSIIPYFNNENIDLNIVRLKFEEIFLNLVNSNKEFVSFLKHIHEKGDNSFKSQIELNFDKFDTIKDMAKHFKMSELNFRNRFKEVYDTTPKKWILNKKLEKAKVLLEQSELNVSEVCHEIGFDNISWFIQSFKKEFGSTPKKQKLNKA